MEAGEEKRSEILGGPAEGGEGPNQQQPTKTNHNTTQPKWIAKTGLAKVGHNRFLIIFIIVIFIITVGGGGVRRRVAQGGPGESKPTTTTTTITTTTPTPPQMEGGGQTQNKCGPEGWGPEGWGLELWAPKGPLSPGLGFGVWGSGRNVGFWVFGVWVHTKIGQSRFGQSRP